MIILQCGLLGFGSEPKGRPINRRMGPFVNRPPQQPQPQQQQPQSQQLQQQVKPVYCIITVKVNLITLT